MVVPCLIRYFIRTHILQYGTVLLEFDMFGGTKLVLIFIDPSKHHICQMDFNTNEVTTNVDEASGQIDGS